MTQETKKHISDGDTVKKILFHRLFIKGKDGASLIEGVTEINIM